MLKLQYLFNLQLRQLHIQRIPINGLSEYSGEISLNNAAGFFKDYTATVKAISKKPFKLQELKYLCK